MNTAPTPMSSSTSNTSSSVSAIGTPGQMSYFNLSSCPSGWTQQVQLDRTINPDTPMVLCRKD